MHPGYFRNEGTKKKKKKLQNFAQKCGKPEFVAQSAGMRLGWVYDAKGPRSNQCARRDARIIDTMKSNAVEEWNNVNCVGECE